MKILSFDQSTSCTGYAIFEDNELKTFGVIKPDKKINENNMYSMFLKIIEKVESEKPDLILIEDVYLKKLHRFNKKKKIIEEVFNVSTHKKLCNLQGMLIAYFLLHEMGFATVTPKTWQSQVIKKKIVEKKDTLSFVNEKYSINLKKKDDDNIADAICIGLYYCV